MIFLQPWMLLALPLAAIPILIHLINQRRYQTTQWAAMRFLLAANKMNRGYAKIRQWAILAARTAVIAMLVIAIGRPLASGFLGRGVGSLIAGGGPGNRILLLDRSPSMQSRGTGQSSSKLQTAVAQVTQTFQTMGADRLVLIDSNSMQPRELNSVSELADLPQVGPSGASADIPGMLQSALDHIQANQWGDAEIWICSDLREHDWHGEDGRWKALRQAFAKFERRVRFRLLLFSDPEDQHSSDGNYSVRLEEAELLTEGDDAVASLSVLVQATQADQNVDESIPVTFDVDGTRSTVDVTVRQGVGKLVGHRLTLGRGQNRGRGCISIPADSNPADNDFYFTCNSVETVRCVVVTEDEDVAKVLQLAAGIAPSDKKKHLVEIISPSEVASIVWDDLALVFWHAALPTPQEGNVSATLPNDDRGPGGGDVGNPADVRAGNAEALQAYVDRGGQVIFLPPDPLETLASSAKLFSMSWKDWVDTDESESVSTWRGDADLLSATLSGAALPVGTIGVQRYVTLEGDGTPLAVLGDGSPLLSRAPTRRGGVYFLATTPKESDSSLAVDGVVLYVLAQRVLAQGATAMGNTRQLDAGESEVDLAATWRRLEGNDSSLSTENAFQIGVYEQPRDQRWLAVNRTIGEDQSQVVNNEKLDSLFRGLIYDRVDQQVGRSDSLVEEIWRACLILMIAAMLTEALLCLPRKRVEGLSQTPGGAAA